LIPTSTASSKLFFEEEIISVTLAIDIGTPFLSRTRSDGLSLNPGDRGAFYADNDGTLTATFNIVPEPFAGLLMGIGSVIFAATFRRSRWAGERK
jgi:hypothetical protein